MIAGVYIGNSRPTSDILFENLIEQIDSLNIDGINVLKNDNSIQLKINFYGLVCDGPATSISMNMVSHSGYYPCRYCLVRGINLFLSCLFYKIIKFISLNTGTEGEIKFPPTSFDYSSRTPETFENHSEIGTFSDPYFGVKGPTKISKKVCF